ncbi:MAG: hypothetical protein WC889_02920 [Myxococcota bacterium]|jgi:hypothetical protein
MSKHPFAPGDCVVCVAEPDEQYRPLHGDWPNKGRAYRVTALVRGNDGRDPNAPGVILAAMNHLPSWGYHSDCFRHISDENDAALIERIKRCKAPADRSKVGVE